jgi:hypothetical protein
VLCVVQGALSQVENILPLLDEYRAISLLQTIVNIEPITLTLAAAGVLAADGILIAAVPDSSTELIVLQVVLTILALVSSAPLFIGAQLNTIIQGTTQISVAIPTASNSAAKSSQSAPKGSRPASSRRPAAPAGRAVDFSAFERIIGD